MKNLICFELRKIFSKRLTQFALAVGLLLSALLAFYGSEGLDCSILFAQLTYIEGASLSTSPAVHCWYINLYWLLRALLG